ncbi:MAG TPA: 2-C-methyl-D-erythritol 2,4-cyclodiphosphate synthase [Chitinophagaceae bacterium]|jgi:2-C-methyl-D-erythritol 2,4-cyclodiphosphate synthase|nr:2-C-methyl-D-erythritol 2,4-cyclodiphosphate synthase [Chitinophagaceae bacterium]
MYRIGYGIDYHQMVEDRDFWLGGIKIPHTKGALGHSDADVLLHAICDAILGAVGAGDIGTHFPDNDQSFKDIDSKILLKKSNEILHAKGFEIVNIDSTVCLQLPKIKPYINAMQEAISATLNIDIDLISIKATTTEQLGFVGREEGIVAHANVLVKKIGA